MRGPNSFHGGVVGLLVAVTSIANLLWTGETCSIARGSDSGRSDSGCSAAGDQRIVLTGHAIHGVANLEFSKCSVDRKEVTAKTSKTIKSRHVYIYIYDQELHWDLRLDQFEASLIHASS